MNETFARTELLIGEDGLKKLRKARVAVFGLGGGGGYAVAALARSGVGPFLLVDPDVVGESNLNRQIIALRSTLGRYKTAVMKERIADICPETEVETQECFFLPEHADRFDVGAFDYVVDAIDTVTGKLSLVMQAKAAGTPIICSMGAGNKLDPSRFEVADLYETSVCPLARVMRAECRKRGIDHLKVVYSREEPLQPSPEEAAQAAAPAGGAARPGAPKKRAPGSIAFVPSAAGLVLAGEVIRDLALPGQ